MASTSRFRAKPDCGTRSGYDFHAREMNELPCQPCRDANAAYWREQRQKRKDRINALRRAWQKKFPYRRRFSKDTVIATYGADCHICGEAIDLNAPTAVGAPGWELGFHPDHVLPISKGGLDTLDNIRPAHAYCNHRKWATIKEGN